MNSFENSDYRVSIEQGLIREFCDLHDPERANCVKSAGKTGAACFTLTTDDVKDADANKGYLPYKDRLCAYDEVIDEENGVVCIDHTMQVRTQYIFGERLVIRSSCSSENVSQYGLQFDLNFLATAGTDFSSQLLPTSPYTSEDGRFMYCMMLRPDGRVLVVLARSICAGWRIQYSYAYHGHTILGFQMLSDFDRAYRQSAVHDLEIELFFAASAEEAYQRIVQIYQAPACLCLLSGQFGGGKALVQLLGDADYIRIQPPVGEPYMLKPERNVFPVEMETYGFYNVTPYAGEIGGLNTVLWYGESEEDLFVKACDACYAPYHNDRNLCEGGMFLWAMLVNMRQHGAGCYDGIVLDELREIMGERGIPVPNRTIVPYAHGGYAPFHICQSTRIQEQFNGISILLEASRVYQNDGYLEFAIRALDELEDNWITPEGMIWRTSNGRVEDYTTVLPPVMTICDMCMTLRERKDPRAARYEALAIRVADFLVQRGLDFPTEGIPSDRYEDGSISCTALSLLYVCRFIRYDERYLRLAGEVLDLHRAWTIRTPDVRMYQSSFRWWETIWEGDREGPAICAGHAWTIWQAEAQYLYGLLARDTQSMIDSWNAFMTNFCKYLQDGTGFACYEPDYIRGGGYSATRAKLIPFPDENPEVSFRVAHGYPQHTDRSLSRYVFVRYAQTWRHTALITCVGGQFIAIHAKQGESGWVLDEHVDTLYLGEGMGTEILAPSVALNNLNLIHAQ